MGVLGGVPCDDTASLLARLRLQRSSAAALSPEEAGLARGSLGGRGQGGRGRGRGPAQAAARPPLASELEAAATVLEAAQFPRGMPDARRYASDHLAIGCVLKL